MIMVGTDDPCTVELIALKLNDSTTTLRTSDIRLVLPSYSVILSSSDRLEPAYSRLIIASWISLIIESSPQKPLRHRIPNSKYTATHPRGYCTSHVELVVQAPLMPPFRLQTMYLNRSE
ncbi:hypothetical protein JAAARDRAFT_413491 [Jaapia argillacea MUCL 33604]|uniref:Uncharacterized protein n=1 Tax=Jaapia argillacea MUCL 33604 TaxID=933084 RepID=A0A067PGX5_9AGAM|nr:hypothetical protein JAAARDRAFT_413491 [Jaapia argillacea MUCL 33604]